MAGLQTQTVVPGSPRFALNDSIRIMQNAISNEASDRRDRVSDAVKATQGARKLAGQEVTRDILKNTDRNVFNQKVADAQQKAMSDDVNQRYKNLFNPDGSRKILSDPTKQAALLDAQNQWESGNIFNKWGEKDAQKLGMIEDTAKGYSDRIYQNLLQQGLTPDEAEKVRKEQLARYAKPDMTKREQETLKTRRELLKNRYDAQTEALKDVYKETSNTQYRAPGSSSSRGGSGYSRGSKGSTGTELNFTNLGARDLKNNPYGTFEFWDKLTGSGKEDFANTSSQLENMGFSKRDIQKIYKMPGSVDDYGGDNPSINEEQLLKNAKSALENKQILGGTYGSGGRGGSGEYSSQSFSGIRDKAGYLQAMDKINSDYQKAMGALLPKAQGQKVLLGNDRIEDIFGSKIDTSGAGKSNKTVLPTSTSGSRQKTNPKIDLSDNDESYLNRRTNREVKATKDRKILEEAAHQVDGPNKYSNGILGGTIVNSPAYNAQNKIYKTSDDVKDLTKDELIDILKVQRDRHPNGNRLSTLAEKELLKRSGGDKSKLDEILDYIGSFNMTLKGEGRDTNKTINTKGGDFRLLR